MEASAGAGDRDQRVSKKIPRKEEKFPILRKVSIIRRGGSGTGRIQVGFDLHCKTYQVELSALIQFNLNERCLPADVNILHVDGYVLGACRADEMDLQVKQVWLIWFVWR